MKHFDVNHILHSVCVCVWVWRRRKDKNLISLCFEPTLLLPPIVCRDNSIDLRRTQLFIALSVETFGYRDYVVERAEKRVGFLVSHRIFFSNAVRWVEER